MIGDVAKVVDLLGGPPYRDYIMLAGKRSPGLAVVRGAGSPRNWDIRQGYGFTGAFVVFTGGGLAKFEVDIFAWESSHFEDWKTFARRTLMPPTRGMRALSMSIAHPQLNDPPLSITQVVIEDVTQWEQSPSDDGLWARTIKMIQFRGPMPALITPAQGPTPLSVVVAPPATPEEREISALTAEVSRLGGL